MNKEELKTERMRNNRDLLIVILFIICLFSIVAVGIDVVTDLIIFGEIR